MEGFDDRIVGGKVAFELTRFDVEDIDQNTDVRKDVLALGIQVVLRKRVLSSTTSAMTY